MNPQTVIHLKNARASWNFCCSPINAFVQYCGFLDVRFVNNYQPQRSCGQGNIFTPVCHSFCSQGGLPQCMLGYPPPGADTPLSRPPTEQTPPQEQTPRSRHPPRSRLQHTVSERPVRILLECILVFISLHFG